MIDSRDPTLLAYVHTQLGGDPALAHERYGGRTLLHAAAAAGSLPTVELLLCLGADPNSLDGGRHTPLYCVGNECASEESAEVVLALVRAGAQVDANDGVTGATPLHMAARSAERISTREIAAAIRRWFARSTARSRMWRNC